MQSLQVLSIIILALQSSISAFAFNISPVATVLSSTTTHDDASTSRRSLLNHLALTSLVAGGLCSSSQVANASGGATAGGAYLLSAKQRYNERVKTSVQGLLTVGESLKGGSTNEAKAYFSSDEAGSWKDLTAAGYLLSNAFRRSSTTAPDSLPAVKKYKAFAKEVDELQKKLKKGATQASDKFPAVEASLNVWLSEIELPSAREL